MSCEEVGVIVGHFAKVVGRDLSVDVGAFQIMMTEQNFDIQDLGALIQEGLREGMPQEMGTVMRPLVAETPAQAAFYDGLGVGSHRPDRRRDGQKNLRMGTLRPRRGIVAQSLEGGRRDGHCLAVASFALPEQKRAVVPIYVREEQSPDLPVSKAVAGHQGQDRVVSFAGQNGSVDALKGLLDFPPRQIPGPSVPPKPHGRHHQPRQILGQDASELEISQKRAEAGNKCAKGDRLHAAGNLGQESVQVLDAEAADVLKALLIEEEPELPELRGAHREGRGLKPSMGAAKSRVGSEELGRQDPALRLRRPLERFENPGIPQERRDASPGIIEEALLEEAPAAPGSEAALLSEEFLQVPGSDLPQAQSTPLEKLMEMADAVDRSPEMPTRVGRVTQALEITFPMRSKERQMPLGDSRGPAENSPKEPMVGGIASWNIQPTAGDSFCGIGGDGAVLEGVAHEVAQDVEVAGQRAWGASLGFQREEILVNQAGAELLKPKASIHDPLEKETKRVSPVTNCCRFESSGLKVIQIALNPPAAVHSIYPTEIVKAAELRRLWPAGEPFKAESSAMTDSMGLSGPSVSPYHSGFQSIERACRPGRRGCLKVHATAERPLSELSSGELATPEVEGQRGHLAAAAFHEEVRHRLESAPTQGAQGPCDRRSSVAMKLDDEGRQKGEGMIAEPAVEALDGDDPGSRQGDEAAQVHPVPAQAAGARADGAAPWFCQVPGAHFLKVAFDAAGHG